MFSPTRQNSLLVMDEGDAVFGFNWVNEVMSGALDCFDCIVKIMFH